MTNMSIRHGCGVGEIRAVNVATGGRKRRDEGVS